MIKAPLPPTIELGQIQISLYGLLIGIGAITILEILSRKFKQIKTIDYLILGLFALIGGKALFIFSHVKSLGSMDLFTGGFRIYGVILGLILGVLVITKYRKLSRFKFYDALFLAFPLVQALGRVGNFLNNELYGKPTDLFWAVYIPIESRVAGFEEYSTFHPLFLYEIILNLLNWSVLFVLSKKRWVKPGTVASLFLINYGLIRLLLNTIRLDLDYVGGMEVSNFLSVLAISIGSLVIFAKYSKSRVRKRVAQVFSTIFNAGLTMLLPLVLATFTIGSININEIIITILAVLSPLVVYILLRRLGRVSDLDISDRKQRPLFIALLTGLLGVIYWLSMFWGFVLVAELLLVLVFLNLFFLVISLFWKISGHMTFLIYTLVSLYVIYDVPELLYLFALVPYVAWSRVQLKHHSVAQVVMGTVTAFIITTGLYWLI